VIKSTFGEKTNSYLALFEEDGVYFTYRGYIDLLLQDPHIAPYLEIYEETTGIDIEPPEKVGAFELRPYQREAIKKALEAGSGQLVLPTGAGKTIVALGIVKTLNKPTLYLVPRSSLVEQTYKKFLQSGAFSPKEVGILYGKKKELRNITIATFQTAYNFIRRYPQQMRKFEVVIFDESHTTQQANLGRYIDYFYRDKAFVFGLTATLYRRQKPKSISDFKTLEDFIMFGYTGNTPIYEITLSELIEQGYLTRPYIVVERIPRGEKDKKVFSYNWHRVYKRYIERDPIRNKKISRWIQVFDKLGLKSLTLVNTKVHAQEIAKLIPEEIKERTFLIFGGGEGYRWNGVSWKGFSVDYAKFLKEAEESTEPIHIIATQVFDMGVDLPSLNALIFGYAGRSAVQVFQRLGRALRLSPLKKRTFVIDFVDYRHPYLIAQAKERQRYFRGEPALRVLDKERDKETLLKLLKEEALFVKQVKESRSI